MSNNRATVNVHVWEDMDIKVDVINQHVWVNMAEVAFFPNNGKNVADLLREIREWGETICFQADTLLMCMGQE